MKALRASFLYDGVGSRRNVYILFDDRIMKVSDEKPDCDIVGEGVVTPAFIDAHCHIGLARAGEPGYEGETNDEIQHLLPLNSAIDSIYMDDPSFGESLEFGVLYSHVMPGSGNLVGGRTVLIRNWSSDIEDALFREVGMKAALGYNPRSTKDWKGERPTTRMGTIGLLRRELKKAMKAGDLVKKGKKEIEEIDPVTEALITLMKGKVPMMVHVHKSDDLIILRNLMNEFGLRVVANHCGDIHSDESWRKLKEAGIPVIYGPIDSFAYKVELKHSSWKNVESLLRVRPKFGLMTDHPVVLQRDLFMQLRHFLRYGMSREKAISIITKENAEILGISELGTIEAGKLASMVVWSDDPFSMEAHVKLCVCEGRVIKVE